MKSVKTVIKRKRELLSFDQRGGTRMQSWTSIKYTTIYFRRSCLNFGMNFDGKEGKRKITHVIESMFHVDDLSSF